MTSLCPVKVDGTLAPLGGTTMFSSEESGEWGVGPPLDRLLSKAQKPLRGVPLVSGNHKP